MNQNSFEEKVAGYIKEQGMLEKGCSVTLGVSGGADSVCLFFMLLNLKNEYELDLNVIHVMHGIRQEEAVRDMEFTKALCEGHNVRFRCVNEDVPELAAKKGLSIEEAGRMVRYAAFEKEGSDRIAVAHNLNDLAETVLLNLIRGSSIKGLSGISPVNGKIIRPLLAVSRQEIEEYLKNRGQEWCTDSTNADNGYARNRIRNVLLVEAEKINPMAVEHIAASAAEIKEAEAFLSSKTEKAYETYCREDGNRIYIRTEAALRIDPFILKRVIYEALGRLSGKKKDIASVHVRDTENLFHKQSGRSIDLIYGLSATRSFDEVIIEKKTNGKKNDDRNINISLKELLEAGSIRLNDGRTLEVEVTEMPDGKFTKVSNTNAMDYDKIDIDALIRVRQSGDRMGIRGGHKKVKDILIEHKIPSDKRDDVLLLANENEVFWIGNIRVAEICTVREDTKRILNIRIKEV